MDVLLKKYKNEKRNAHKEKLEDKAGEIERDIDLFYQTNEITPLLKSISQKVHQIKLKDYYREINLTLQILKNI